MALVSPKARSTEKKTQWAEYTRPAGYLFFSLGLPSQARWRGSPAGQLDIYIYIYITYETHVFGKDACFHVFFAVSPEGGPWEGVRGRVPLSPKRVLVTSTKGLRILGSFGNNFGVIWESCWGQFEIKSNIKTNF